MSSEELLQTIPQEIGKCTYYRLGNTTLHQLKNNGIILRRDYGSLETTKPDGLVPNQGWVRTMVEYKQPRELRAKQDIEKAIHQQVDVAKALCKILIVNNSAKSFWVNALNGNLPRKRRIRRQNDTGRSLS